MPDDLKAIKARLAAVVDPAFVEHWFEAPNPAFAGHTPHEVYAAGDGHLLWLMLYQLESGTPS